MNRTESTHIQSAVKVTKKLAQNLVKYYAAQVSE